MIKTKKVFTDETGTLSIDSEGVVKVGPDWEFSLSDEEQREVVEVLGAVTIAIKNASWETGKTIFIQPEDEKAKERPWIKWDASIGDKCPVPNGTWCKVKLADGDENEDEESEWWNWGGTENQRYNIVAFQTDEWVTYYPEMGQPVDDDVMVEVEYNGSLKLLLVGSAFTIDWIGVKRFRIVK